MNGMLIQASRDMCEPVCRSGCSSAVHGIDWAGLQAVLSFQARNSIG